MHPNITKLQAKFPDLDFSEFEYGNAYTRSKVKCPIHGEFEQTYLYFYKIKTKIGCPMCRGRITDTETFLKKLKSEYSEEALANIDLDQVSYETAEKAKIVCKLHGEYVRYTDTMFKKEGRGDTPCPKCNDLRGRIKFPRSFPKTKWSEPKDRSVIEKELTEIYGDNLDLSAVTYLGARQKIDLVCKKHGYFGSSLPTNILRGRGAKCNKCNPGALSSGEVSLLEFCCTLGPPVVSNVSFRNKMRPDILFPTKNVLVEYHGLWFHREGYRGRTAHQEKVDYFSSLGMKLLQVFEDEWISQRDKVEERIRAAVGVTSTIDGRKTVLRTLDKKKANDFLEAHHMQGGVVTSTHCYGLFYGDALVSVATFGTPRSKSDIGLGFFELHRFASVGRVTGGFSKLLQAFEQEVKPYRIVSYADRRWGEGEVYGKAGFTKTKATDPGYYWCKGQKRFSRWNFQKYKLQTWDNYSDEKTEDQICSEKGYYKIYDAGHNRWEKHYGNSCRK